MEPPEPLKATERRVNASAPIRICDCGGWTDTWFARSGCVFHIAVTPRVELQVTVLRGDEPRLVVRGSAADVPYVRSQPLAGETPSGPFAPIEAVLQHMNVPADLSLEITIDAEVPPGASTGTSAALVVALVGAIDRLLEPRSGEPHVWGRSLQPRPGAGRLTAHEIAQAAHAVEVERLKQQSGVQDQWCAALGGVNFIEIAEYPHATATPVPLAPSVAWELERRLVLVYLGRSHRSSAVHEDVILRLQAGQDSQGALAALRAAAIDARAAALAGDLDALAGAMRANTEAQAALHPAIVSDDANRLIDLARTAGAVGWKINGAGGEGGSLTLLTGPAASSRQHLIRRIQEADRPWRVIPIALAADGLRVWEPA